MRHVLVAGSTTLCLFLGITGCANVGGACELSSCPSGTRCVPDGGDATCVCDVSEDGWQLTADGSCVCPAGKVVDGGWCLDPNLCAKACTEPNRAACELYGDEPVCFCDPGYELVAGVCLESAMCDGACTEPHRTICKLTRQGPMCGCDEGYYLGFSGSTTENQCLPL